MPFPDEPCAACPRAARGLPMPCRAMTTGHARFCDLTAAGDTRYDALLCDERPVTPFPSLATQAANLAGAVVRFVASGLEQATPEQQAERAAVCRGCEEFKDGRCRHCGCHLALKIRAASEHCPLGKW